MYEVLSLHCQILRGVPTLKCLVWGVYPTPIGQHESVQPLFQWISRHCGKIGIQNAYPIRNLIWNNFPLPDRLHIFNGWRYTGWYRENGWRHREKNILKITDHYLQRERSDEANGIRFDAGVLGVALRV